MERVCVLLHIKPERLDEYVDVHRAVWPSMLAALSAAGWHNYSLFLRKDDGLVVGYFETDDAVEAVQRMDADPVNALWQKSMAQYFAVAAQTDPLTEYFHLD